MCRFLAQHSINFPKYFHWDLKCGHALVLSVRKVLVDRSFLQFKQSIVRYKRANITLPHVSFSFFERLTTFVFSREVNNKQKKISTTDLKCTHLTRIHSADTRYGYIQTEFLLSFLTRGNQQNKIVRSAPFFPTLSITARQEITPSASHHYENFQCGNGIEDSGYARNSGSAHT